MTLSDILAKAILSAHSDAIIAANCEGIIQFWNPGAERIFGHAGSDAIGCSLDLIVPERLRQRHWDGFRQTLESGKSRYGAGDLLSVPAIRKDGVTISIEFTVALLHNNLGQILGIAALLRDVTKRYEEMRILKRKLAEAVRS